MKYLEIDQLDGIPDRYNPELTDLVPKIQRKELLAVVLFFMSDLNDDAHRVKEIERNIKKIHNKTYKDYVASCIYGYLNKESSKEKNGLISNDQRLFKKIKEGYWRNSTLGNRLAKQVLEKHGYDCIVSNRHRPSGRKTTEKIKTEVNEIFEHLGSLKGEERSAMIKVRVNQGKFRQLLLARYSSCVICGLAHTKLLIASHIKSWSDSMADEKLDPDNGFLLCPDHDALFDKHYISFQSDGSILIASHLDQAARDLLHIDHRIKINLLPGNEPYLAYHRALFASTAG